MSQAIADGEPIVNQVIAPTALETAAAHASLTNFVYHEAMLLDTRQYEAWLSLFTQDGLYWMPLSPDDGVTDSTPPDESPALLYEDLLLLRLRVQRYANPRAHSLHPAVRGLRVLQAPAVIDADESSGKFHTRTPFMYVETQGDTQRVLAATAYHTLVREAGQWRIQRKKVVLLNADASLPAIQLLL
ncbi:2-halobenzoate 1,2-dioxygenase small subunit [Bordetella tumbae]|uniref:aromatic-ring-hydroxylating dioxygenase subunit beta n=1 Tax=Bordetella tumbae TaxID=1649139 RepID=UPI0039EDF1E8